MPFKDIEEGTTHNDNDSCIKCEVCKAHFWRGIVSQHKCHEPETCGYVIHSRLEMICNEKKPCQFHGVVEKCSCPPKGSANLPGENCPIHWPDIVPTTRDLIKDFDKKTLESLDRWFPENHCVERNQAIIFQTEVMQEVIDLMKRIKR